jgi:hypothetical protein
MNFADSSSSVETHVRPRQRRIDRRVEGRLSQRLVRRAPLGYGEHLKTLCREPEKRRPSRRHRRAGAGDRQPLSRREVSRACGTLLTRKPAVFGTL